VNALPAPPPGSELDSLLVRCAAGDRAAFRQVYDRVGGRLYGVALRMTRSPTLAADAVQDAMVQAWQEAGRFDPARGNAEAWLLALARYRTLDLVRRQGREVPGYVMADQGDDGPSALDTLAEDEQAAQLRGCLARLDQERQRLLTLAFVEGLSHSEIAGVLGQPLGTVKSWIRRGLIALRDCLQGRVP
jgi:RNA polymerase sigma-70 factor (ECF subfamily)